MTNKQRFAGEITVLLLFAVWARVGQAQSAPPLTTLHSFSALSNGFLGTNADGVYPNDVLQAIDGNLYGTAFYGGAKGAGTVFRITTSGTLKILHSFRGLDGNGSNPNSAIPNAGLIQGKDGALYGTTFVDGANDTGTIFRITTGGAYATIHTFSALDSNGNNSDGAYPNAGLIQAIDGNLYGTTYYGGANGDGTVFRITTGGALKTLWSFSARSTAYPFPNSDGAYPSTRLLQAKDRNLYGTTEYAGPNGFGTVFRITTGGKFTPLHSFNYYTDGGYPSGGLIQAMDGNLYGTTFTGGAHGNGFGTLFQITTAGDLATLHSFLGTGAPGNNADGAAPTGGLIQARDGNLYGTTFYGGANSTGAVFRITTAGALTTVYSFGGGIGYPLINSDGADPDAGVILAKDGNLYGTAYFGGGNGFGTLFKLTMTPIITSFSPTSGPIGSTVTVYSDFTEATAVKIGALSATFTINPNTSLTFVVPAGAKSAKITVTNPFGKATSSTAFKVTP